MKRRLLSAFLAVMMVLTMAPVAFAADSGEASSTEEVSTAAALQTALTNATDGTVIKLTDNITVSSRAKFSGQSMTVTLDLNNYTLTGSDGDYALSNENGNGATTGKLIVKNGTIKRADDVKQSNSTVRNYGQMELNNVQVQGNYIVVKNEETATLTMNNCTLTAPDVYGNNQTPSGLQNWGTTTANNCTIKSGTAVMAASWADSKRSYDSNTDLNDCIISGSSYAVSSGRADKSTAKQTVNVNGGSYTGNIDSGAGSDITINAEIKGKMSVVNDFSYNLGSASYITSGPSKVTLAEGGSVSGTINAAAKNGNTYYSTVTNAVEEATNGNTIELVQDTTEDVVIPADKTVTLDLNGKKLTNVASHTIFNNGTLTINGEGTVDNVTHGKAALVNYGTAMLNNGVTLKRSSEKGTLVPYNNGGNSYYTILNDKGATMTINNATVENSGGYSSAICNGGDPQCNKESYLTINDGNFSGGINTVKNDGLGILTINGGTFSNSSQYVVMNWHKAEFHGTATFSANAMAEAVLFTSSYDNSPIMAGELKVFDGYYKAATDKQALIRDHYDADNKGTAIISGGYFTIDPSAYCVTGKTGVPSGNTTYPWTVGTIEAKDENEIKTDIQEGATQATLSGEIAADKQDDARNVGTSVTPTKLTDTTPITETEKNEALTELVKNNKVTLESDGTIPQDTTVTVVKKTYLDVTVTAYDTTNNTVSMNIVPKYDLIAVAKTGTDEKKVTLKSEQDAKVGSTEVKVTLPDAFKGKKVYINHNNGANLYVATANATTGEITFTTNGFSPFTFALTNSDVVAEVNGNAYKSLQDAANAAKDGDEITVVQNKNLDLTFNTTKSVKVTNKTNDKITVKFNGTDEGVAAGATKTFSYTKPSSGGSSGGSSSGKTTYKVTTSAVNNGGVNASPSSAEKGATITITLSPDKGYKLDKLTVTDGSGKTVSTVKKSDTVYTFTMPASAVKVGVSYVKATETPSETKFNDVSANDWFASAVDYVTGKGMMNGTADNTFSPKANTTRGMVVTVLYRLENQPSTSAASFTDVASGAYYANAVAWANANGIVSGYGSGKFGPNDKVTREQLAAILYRYAQYKKYDVSVGEDTNILSYDDAQSISSYAIPAIQWACGAGVVTGKSGSKLDPKGNATRAEVAAMLMRFCENVK